MYSSGYPKSIYFAIPILNPLLYNIHPVQIIKVKDLIYPAQYWIALKNCRQSMNYPFFGVKTSNTYILFLTKPFFLFLDIVIHKTYIHLYSLFLFTNVNLMA